MDNDEIEAKPRTNYERGVEQGYKACKAKIVEMLTKEAVILRENVHDKDLDAFYGHGVTIAIQKIKEMK